MKTIESNRNFMKSHFNSSKTPSESDQVKGVSAPSLQIPPKEGNEIISLPSAPIIKYNLYDAMTQRRSLRKYSLTAMHLNELSFILETSCKVQKIIGDNIATFRPAPSGGARHPFETYIVVNNVDGLNSGLYHYLPLTHQLEKLKDHVDDEKIVASVNGQKFVSDANVIFYFAVIPYRAEWRYIERSHKVMLLDLGHVGQNICLAAEATHSGACPIASYDQEIADNLFELDGNDAYISYIIPVGKKSQ